MLLLYLVGNHLSKGAIPSFSLLSLSQLPAIVGYVSIGGLIGSAPAACLNAYLLDRAGKNDMDATWFAMLSGALMGGIVFVALAALTGGNAFQRSSGMIILALFAATGACMGMLHWLIAIRPRRNWRKRLMYDTEAIRAME
jgi:predicted membrane protein